MAWVLDLDGVVWLADQAIAGSAAAVAELRAAGQAVAFVTNNSYGRRGDVEAKLARHGIDPQDGVITSAMAAASLVEPGEVVLVCGGPGITEAVEARGATPVAEGPADAVVVGYDPAFDYARMTAAAAAVRGGARLLATNDDATYPTPAGPIPGGGAILASIVTASGAPVRAVAGKPHPPVCDLVRAKVGESGTVVGDRPDTDGRFALALGWRFALVLSGVTGRGDLPTTPPADVVGDDLASLVRDEIAS